MKTYTIRTTHGTREIDAEEPLPGFLIHASFGEPGWSLTHAGTGCRIAQSSPRIRSAKGAARVFKPILDSLPEGAKSMDPHTLASYEPLRAAVVEFLRSRT